MPAIAHAPPAAAVAPRRRHRLRLRGRDVELGSRTWIMGILNATPDSFSDGGQFLEAGRAIDRGLALFEAGADVVDVGGESTRSGASPVPVLDEVARVVPVVAGLRRQCSGLVSVDTTKAEVARAALDAGADVVNDVSALAHDPAMASLIATRGVPVVLMHLRGPFDGMHRDPAYGDVMGEIAAELQDRVAAAERAGIERGQLLIDPGIGFSKGALHSLEVLRRLPELAALALPVLVGPSRKSFIGQVLGRPAGERLLGTAAAVAACVLAGAHVVRVHDVAEMAQVARLADAIRGAA